MPQMSNVCYQKNTLCNKTVLQQNNFATKQFSRTVTYCKNDFLWQRNPSAGRMPRRSTRDSVSLDKTSLRAIRIGGHCGIKADRSSPRALRRVLSKTSSSTGEVVEVYRLSLFAPLRPRPGFRSGLTDQQLPCAYFEAKDLTCASWLAPKKLLRN